MDFHEGKKRHLWNLINHHLADLLLAWTSFFTNRTVTQHLIYMTNQSTHLQQLVPRDFVISVEVIKTESNWKNRNMYKSRPRHWAHLMKFCKCSWRWSPAPPRHARVTELYTHRATCLSCCWVARWQRRSCSSHCPRWVWNGPGSAWSPWSSPGPL